MFKNPALKLLLSIAFLGGTLAAALYLAGHGVYGWTLFFILPVMAGALANWIFNPAGAGSASGVGAITGAVGCALFLLLGAEGWICVLMALPIVVALSIGGSMMAYSFKTFLKGRNTTAMMLLMPVSMFFDTHATPPLYSVTTSMVVNAPPERVWKNVVAFPDIADEPNWYFRTGVAYPLRTRIEGSGQGSARDCDLSTGTVRERVSVWDEPHLLRFVVTDTPPAMIEHGLYGPIYPKHLDGYYISRQGQFELTALPGGRTLVAGTSWYQHGLFPAAYWRLWSDAVVHRIHTRVLEHIRKLSEAAG